MCPCISVLEHQGEDVVIQHSKGDVLKMMCNLNLVIYPFDVQVSSSLFKHYIILYIKRKSFPFLIFCISEYLEVALS